MQVLEDQDDVRREEPGGPVVEPPGLAQVAEELPPDDALDDHVHVARVLERGGQVHDEGMAVLREEAQDGRLRLDVLDLSIQQSLPLSWMFPQTGSMALCVLYYLPDGT